MSHPLTTCPAETAARVAATSAVEAARAEVAALDAINARPT